MQQLSEILKKRIGKGTLAWQVQASLVVEAAGKVLIKILGEDLVREVKVLYYKDQRVYLATPEPDLATELKLKKSQIIAEVKKATKAEIKDLVVWIR